MPTLTATAAPPDVPAKLETTVGATEQFDIKIEAGKKIGMVKTFDSKECVLARLWSEDPAVMTFLVIPKKVGTFTLVLWTGGETDGVKLAIVVTGGAPVPGPNPPPVDPPPAKPGQIYFMLVRQDGPAQPSFTAIVSDPAWDTLRAAGCLVKDFTLTRARELGAEIPAGRNLPLVVTLKIKPDGSGADQFKTPDGQPWIRDLPSTADGIMKLVEGTK